MVISNSFWAQSIVVNEVLASNTSSIKDEDNSYQDWIELYNSGTTTVNLLGYGLSDDPILVYKWTFPSVSIAAGQYLIVWASDKNRAISGSPLHTNFKISGSGEPILLTNSSGVTINVLPAAFLQPNTSYGRSPDGSTTNAFFGIPTPNASNITTAYSGILSPPIISQNSGFFTNSFNLTLSTTDQGATILYTLDGSEPVESNLIGTTYTYKNQYPGLPTELSGPLLNQTYQTLQYSTPISVTDKSANPNKVSAISSTYDFDPSYYIPTSPVFKGTVLRARIIKPGFLESSVITRNYFVSPQGNSKFTLPVISLSTNEDRLFGYDNGIYVAGKDFDDWRTLNPLVLPQGLEIGNYYRAGINDEKIANMSYFVNGAEVLNQDVGLRIRGSSTRRYECKSLTVFARADYGTTNLNYKVFPDLIYNSFQRLTLSNSGSDFRNTMFRDALDHQICKSLHVESEAYQPAMTFINGEFWGLSNIRERYDNEYFKRVYNAGSVDFLENHGIAQEGDNNNYIALMDYLTANSLTTPANFDYIKTQIDPESFSDFFISNIFLQNSDWPGNNVQYWRNKTASYQPNAPYGLDGRWRWMLHDMDDTFSFGTANFNGNTLATATSFAANTTNPDWSTLLLRKLLENQTYKTDFINRFADLLNTSFLPDRIISKINEMKAVIAPEMAEQTARWKVPAIWQDFIDYEISFANARPAFQRDHIRTTFAIASNINATLDVSNVNQGYIKINTIDVIAGTPGIIGNPYPWTGIYFQNIPVKLTAIAKPGFAFSHWTGASTATNAEITMDSAASFSLTAVFVPVAFAEISTPIYYWVMNSSIVNGTPLTTLNPTYKIGEDASLQYQSCLAGYPFTSGNVNYGKASMERRNSATSLNYKPEANTNLSYALSDMKGIQIKQPFQSGGIENTMIFNLSTTGYKNIKFSFAAVDEGAASAITIDYAVNSGTPVWINTGLSATSLALTSNFLLYETDFTAIISANNNPNFKVRLRFTGPNMTANIDSKVSFNNISVDGAKIPLTYASPNIYSVGSPITNIIPTISETVSNYSITPSLSDGLSINTSTGIISGTPLAFRVQTIYTVTATNSLGNTSFNLVITVNEIAPTSLSYTSSNVLTKNTLISSLNPAISGGAVTNYSVSPSLPLGLNLNTITGIISGTPTDVSPNATFTVTATNSVGNTSFALSFTVNDSAPAALSYSNSNIFTLNSSIASLNPSVSGGTVISYSASPVLPSGLTLNTATGIISGTPTEISPDGTYIITATNSGGNSSFGISMTINDSAPAALSYSNSNIFTRNSAITSLNPSVSGGAVIRYSASPDLPSGLTLNTATGIISGTPIEISPDGTYIITATNSGGNSSFSISITINDSAPAALSYSYSNIFTRNSAIASLSPSVSGGTVIRYSASPDLPSGLTLNTATGIISGTPTEISPDGTYTITATNSGGNSSFEISITINDSAPAALSYSNSNIFTRNSAIASLSPSVSGGTVIRYSASPDLPSGLTLNTATGIISGTPTEISALAAYTITATNSGGNTSFVLMITVENSLNNNTLNLSKFKIYPNPFNNLINVSSTIENVNFKIFSTDGKLIQEGQLQNSQIDFHNLTDGIYMLKLFSEDRIEIKKIIKKN